MRQRGLTPLFDDMLGAPPDKVNGLLNLLTRHGHTAARTVMIGDSYNDYRAARSNGTRFIGVLPEAATHSPFPGNTPCVPDLHALDAALRSLAKL